MEVFWSVWAPHQALLLGISDLSWQMKYTGILWHSIQLEVLIRLNGKVLSPFQTQLNT